MRTAIAPGHSARIGAAQPFAWFRADTVRLSASGLTDALADRADPNHALTFLSRGGSSVRQPAPAASRTCNQQLALDLNAGGDVATSCGYQSTRGAAAWSFLRLSSAWEIWLVHRTRDLVGTGMLLSTGSVAPFFDYYQGAGVETVRNQSELAVSIGQQANTFKCTRLIGGANGGASIQVATATSGASFTLPANGTTLAGNVTAPLTLGLQPVSLSFAQTMEFCDLIVHSAALTREESAHHWAYVSTRYGIPRWSFA